MKLLLTISLLLSLHASAQMSCCKTIIYDTAHVRLSTHKTLELKRIDRIIIGSCLVIAPTMKACMDASTDHYQNSVFARFNNPYFFDHSKGSPQSNLIFGYHNDFWHWCGSVEIMSYCAPFAQVLYRWHPILKKRPFWGCAIYYVGVGVVHNAIFNVNYNYLLKSK